jgi:hypothetical protein
MPRWSGGWGFQILEEYRHRSALLDGTKVVSDDLTEDIHILHIQGVYTWKKWIRATAKIPVVVYAERELPDANGDVTTQTDQGLGDLTLALPLKKYFNLDGRSGSWTVTPQLRAPLAPQDDYDVYDHVWGTGFGLSYETETYRYWIGAGTSAWYYLDEKPYEAAAHFGFGFNYYAFGSSGHIKWKNTLRYEGDDSLTLSGGPLVYFRFTDTVHGQFLWTHDFYDRQGTVDHGNGDALRLGLGFVY